MTLGPGTQLVIGLVANNNSEGQRTVQEPPAALRDHTQPPSLLPDILIYILGEWLKFPDVQHHQPQTQTDHQYRAHHRNKPAWSELDADTAEHTQLFHNSLLLQCRQSYSLDQEPDPPADALKSAAATKPAVFRAASHAPAPDAVKLQVCGCRDAAASCQGWTERCCPAATEPGCVDSDK